jgi:hypothetical protein
MPEPTSMNADSIWAGQYLEACREYFELLPLFRKSLKTGPRLTYIGELRSKVRSTRVGFHSLASFRASFGTASLEERHRSTGKWAQEGVRQFQGRRRNSGKPSLLKVSLPSSFRAAAMDLLLNASPSFKQAAIFECLTSGRQSRPEDQKKD